MIFWLWSRTICRFQSNLWNILVFNCCGLTTMRMETMILEIVHVFINAFWDLLVPTKCYICFVFCNWLKHCHWSKLGIVNLFSYCCGWNAITLAAASSVQLDFTHWIYISYANHSTLLFMQLLMLCIHWAPFKANDSHWLVAITHNIQESQVTNKANKTFKYAVVVYFLYCKQLCHCDNCI